MTVIFTSMARVSDWKALEAFFHGSLEGRARALGAARVQLCRDVQDASRMLVMAEMPDYEAARDLGRVLNVYLSEKQAAAASDEQIWEPTD